MTTHAKNDNVPRLFTRRSALYALGAGFLAAPLVQFLACSPSGNNDGNGDDGGVGSDAGTTKTDGAAVAWATGGTAAMKGTYPDPFATGLGTVCSLTCAATIGPCYAQTVTRKDISEGHLGLPVRLALLLVDDKCAPLQNATVDIWHCGPEGLYSGNDASDFCTNGDATARAARWFRGVQTTDASGRVEFDTCFPGWYSSRSIHIHFTIRVGGTEYVTSQLFFDDALDDEIIATQPLYNTRGARDTKNTTDNVVGGEAMISTYTFQTQRMADGAMLAWKTVVVRANLTDALCEVKGAGGGMGGGPPDGGFGPPPDGFPGGPPDGFPGPRRDM